MPIPFSRKKSPGKADSPKPADAAKLAFKRAAWSLGRHAFGFIVLFIALDVLASLVLAYLFVRAPQDKALPEAFQPPVFDESLYRQDSLAQQARTNALAKNLGALYRNPFQ